MSSWRCWVGQASELEGGERQRDKRSEELEREDERRSGADVSSSMRQPIPSDT